MDDRFKCTTIKLLEVNIRANVWDLGLDEDLSGIA